MEVLVGIISVIVLLYVLWQYQELKKFRVTQYEMSSEKVNNKIKIVVIADLHSFTYGTENEKLLQAVSDQKPDLILIPGDLIVTGKSDRYETALHLVQTLCAQGIPVFCSNGNHESRAALPESGCRPVYLQYCNRLKQAGAVILNNKSLFFHTGQTTVCISGLELPLSSYKKGRKPFLEPRFIHTRLGTADWNHLQILLAHHPAFARQYAAWGADLTVCGHNHGGLVCIPGIGSIISPQFLPFPEFDAGEFTVGNKKIYISRGLGTHTFHIRIFNRAELVAITVNPKPPSMPDLSGIQHKQNCQHRG